MIEQLRNENMLEEIISEVATRTVVARRIVRKTALPQKIEEVNQTATSAVTTANQAQTTANNAQTAVDNAGIVQNDNVAPGVPSAPSVTVFEHNLSITWTPAASTEYVEKTHVRITPSGGTAFTRTTTDTYFIAAELTPDVIHSVEIQFEDRWGLTSGWSAATNATPEKLIAEAIAASTQVAASQISGQLANDQLAQITSPSKLSSAVYETAVAQGSRGANLLPFDRAEGNAYAVGAWPQKGYTTSTGGRDLSIVAHMNDQWWQSVTDSADAINTASMLWSTRENIGLTGTTYVYSAMVKNTGASSGSAQLSVDQSTDAAGTGAAQTHGSAVTIPADGKIYRVFVKFTNDTTKPFKRFWQTNREVSDTLLFNKFQLEEVPTDALGPGRYTMPVINQGAVSARLLAAWDLTAIRAIISTAIIETAMIADAQITTAKIGDAQITAAKILDAEITSAKISSIVADKIVSGTIAAQTITLGTGGKIQAGVGTFLGADGLTLSLAGSYNTPAAAGSYKVVGQTGTTEIASLMFYQNTNPSTNGYFRGAILRADGAGTTSTSYRGAIVLHATPAGTINDQSARLELTALAGTSGRGDCQIIADTTISGNLLAGGNISNNGSFMPHATMVNTSIGASTSTTLAFITWPHGLGTYPTMLQGYVFNSPIEPLPNYTRTVYFWDLTTSAVKIYNENTTSRNAIVRAFR